MLSSLARFLAKPSPRHFFVALTMTLCLLAIAGTARAFAFDTSKDNTAILIGYGQSIPGWGLTTQRVQTIDIVPRYNHVIFDNIGSGWLKGRYTTMVELPIHIVCSPVVSSMIGVNFLACYKFMADRNWRPYIFGGGGPVYSFADIPGMGARWNGNYQFAVGLDHPISPSQSVLFEIRYHHISNGGRTEPNVPLNSIKFMIGLTF